jgi:hypothetical protein
MFVATPRQTIIIQKNRPAKIYHKMHYIEDNKPNIFMKKVSYKMNNVPRETQKLIQLNKLPIKDDPMLSIGTSKVCNEMIKILNDDDKEWEILLNQHDLTKSIIKYF